MRTKGRCVRCRKQFSDRLSKIETGRRLSEGPASCRTIYCYILGHWQPRSTVTDRGEGTCFYVKVLWPHSTPDWGICSPLPPPRDHLSSVHVRVQLHDDEARADRKSTR